MQIQETNKFFYYLKGYFNLIALRVGVKKNIQNISSTTDEYDNEYLKSRTNYYNKLNSIVPISEAKSSLSIKSFTKPVKPSAYFFDLIKYARFFNSSLKLNYLFGDIIHIPAFPSIVKSRPVGLENNNSVLLNLNKARHFKFVKDDIEFEDKKDMLIGRGVITQPHRIDFYKKYFNHPLCDLGKVNNSGENTEWLKPAMSISEHLKYKFILSLEGNDVATNLKWIMSSSSIAVMCKPKYETWFMEGSLIPDHHFICIKDDYTDLEEKLNYYISHPKEALRIVENANKYVKQFQDKKLENIVSLMVLEKYFLKTGQITQSTFNY